MKLDVAQVKHHPMVVANESGSAELDVKTLQVMNERWKCLLVMVELTR